MIKAAPSPAGNEVKLANSAAAIPAITNGVRVEIESPTIGATRMPAAAATAAPVDQVSMARTSGDQPSAAAARWFSAVAVMANPSVVYRASANSVTVSAAAISSSHRRSTEMAAPKTWTTFCGSEDGTTVKVAPYRMVAVPCRTASRPRVAISRVNGAAVRNGLMISRWGGRSEQADPDHRDDEGHR